MIMTFADELALVQFLADNPKLIKRAQTIAKNTRIFMKSVLPVYRWGMNPRRDRVDSLEATKAEKPYRRKIRNTTKYITITRKYA